MKRIFDFESLKRLIPQIPLPQPSLPHVAFASSGGGGRNDGPDHDYYDDVPEGDERPLRREQTQATAARRRTVQSEPDDRYWTDYLRIALPVVGLLLVIAVFWYWAQQLIDDDNDADITATQPGLAEVIETATEETAPASGTPPASDQGSAPQEVVATPPTETSATDPQAQAQPTSTPDPAAQEAPAEGDTGDLSALLEAIPEEDASSAIQPDSAAVVAEDADGTRLRSDTSLAPEAIITQLDAGTTLTVASGPIEAEGFTWWEVVVDATGESGYIAEEFIEPAS